MVPSISEIARDAFPDSPTLQHLAMELEQGTASETLGWILYEATIKPGARPWESAAVNVLADKWKHINDANQVFAL